MQYPGQTNLLHQGIADLVKALFDEDKIPMNTDFSNQEIMDLTKLKLLDTYFLKRFMTEADFKRLMKNDNGVSKTDIFIKDFGKFKIGKSRQGRKELIEALKSMFSDRKVKKESRGDD